MQLLWQQLQQETRPIVLYGMGDGAQKILNVCHDKGIVVRGVFASDDFVRYNQFAGFTVSKLSDLQAQLGEDLVILISFASQLPDLLHFFADLNQKHTVYAPDVPVIGGGLFDIAFARAHRDDFARVYDLLADEPSRTAYANIIRFKLTGKIDHLFACHTAKDEVFRNVLQPTKSEHFCDLGAYNGDTIRELLSYTEGQYASITALEPDRRNFRKLTAYAQEHLTGEVSLHQAGGWHTSEILTFSAKAGRNSTLTGAIPAQNTATDAQKSATQTQMLAVDDLNKPCTYLKMDVEGAERPALLGAAHTLRTQAPKLNIAAYHRNEDLFDLPLLIHQLQPSYRIYLRHHPYVPAWDVNLYATN